MSSGWRGTPRISESQLGTRNLFDTVRAVKGKTMALAELEIERDINPVDMIEHVASCNNWEFERLSDHD